MGTRKIKPPKKRNVKHYRWQHVQTDHPLEKTFIDSLSNGLQEANDVFQLMNGINRWLQVAGNLAQKVDSRRIIVPAPMVEQSDASH